VGTIRPAAATETEVRVQSPHVPSDDHHVDQPVVVADRPDLGVVEVAGATEDALGLVQQAAGVLLPCCEEELSADHLVVGPHVKRVGGTKELSVLGRQGDVEDVAVGDDDLADDGGAGLEQLVIWLSAAAAQSNRVSSSRAAPSKEVRSARANATRTTVSNRRHRGVNPAGMVPLTASGTRHGRLAIGAPQRRRTAQRLAGR
jgi:hypothetical protein